MKFLKNLKKYMPYAWVTAVADLQSQVSESYLGWLWWILDPLLFMLVYTFIVTVVFGTSTEHLPLYVFIGIIMWNFFSSTVNSSVGIIRAYRGIFLKIYLPKYTMIVVQIIINFIKMLIGLAVAFAILFIARIPLTFNFFSIIPILFIYVLLTFGVSLLFSHFGVFIVDLQNVITVLLRLLFYMSGVFYSIDRFPETVRKIYIYICPTGFILSQCRNVIMYGQPANYLILLYWLIISLLLIISGISLLNKYENTYIKVI